VEPEVIAFGTWMELAQLLVRLWFFVLLQVIFAFSLLLAHGVIPSLVGTGHLPASVDRIRPALYIGFLFFLVATIVTISTVFWTPQALIDVLYDAIYSRRWV